jgi:hypothetical protein
MTCQSGNTVIYQLRVLPGQTLDDVVTELTQAVWNALEEGRLDPHRWPGLYEDFKNVFKKRIFFHEGCGGEPECRFSLKVYAKGTELQQRPGGPIYLLIVKRGLLEFVPGLADLAWRRLRSGLGSSASQRRKMRQRFQDALHRALIGRLFYNEACVSCRAREGAPERRLWEKREGPLEDLLRTE